MEGQDLKNIWKSASKEEITINTDQLMDDFKLKMERREQIVRRRDLREIIAALIGLIGFGYSYYAYSNTFSRVGSILGLLALIYIIYKLRSNRKNKTGQKLFLPIREQMLHQHRFMLNQYKLLDTVIYWVSTPLFMANSIIVWGLSKPNDTSTLLDQITEKWEIKIVITIILAIVFGYIGWMNKKAAEVNWKPLIQQLNALLKNLKEEEK